MERKIGEIFEYNSEWYQCVEGYHCYDCDFRHENGTCIIYANYPESKMGNCNGNYRTDNQNVVFKKLEKNGKPYEHYGKLYQCYKLLMEIEISLLPNNCYPVGKDNLVEIEIKQKEDMEEDMEENKLNLKPFDIQKAREGKPVCTRDGRRARIICFDMNSFNNHIIVALITEENGTESIYSYTSEGKWKETKTENDLMMLSKKKEGWVNIYKSDNGTYYTGAIFYEKNDALVNTAEIEITTGIPIDCIDTVKIEWEE